MNHRFLKVTVALAAVPALALAAGKSADAPGQDIHFMQGGKLDRGVRCATENPSAEHRRQVEDTLKMFGATMELSGCTAPANVTIPVKWHVVRSGTAISQGNIPDTWIQNQIQVLNAAYQGTGFSFTLASIDRTTNSQWYTGCYGGGERKMKKALGIDTAHYLHIYSCRPSQGILGYAYFPNSFPENDYRHGVVLLDQSVPGGNATPYNLGDTATHEVGHYLGLYHTFQGGCNNPGDSVGDTEPEASAAFGCPVGRDTCGAASTPDDPIRNFMDYTDDQCMFEFTCGQQGRMHTLTSQYRPTIY
jgi:hypothetical protein